MKKRTPNGQGSGKCNQDDLIKLDDELFQMMKIGWLRGRYKEEAKKLYQHEGVIVKKSEEDE